MATDNQSPSTLVHFMELHARQQPDKLYLRHGHGKAILDVTFGDLWSVAQDFRKSFGRTDLKGRVCFLFFGSGPEAYLTFWGLIAAGAIPALMPLPSAKQEPEQYWASHKKLFETTRPAAVFAGGDDLLKMAEYGLFEGGIAGVATEYDLAGSIRVACDVHMGTVNEDSTSYENAEPAEIAFLQHSSGTTGLKKGVMLTHQAVLRQVAAYKIALDASDQDVFGTWLPLYHDMGLISCTVMPMVLGSTVRAIDPFVWTMRPMMLLDIMEQEKATLCWMPNFAFEHMARNARKAKHTRDLSHVRGVISCSEVVKPRSLDAFEAAFSDIGLGGPRLSACYAMAETVFAVSQAPLTGVVARKILSREALQLNKLRTPTQGEQTVTLASSGQVVDGLDVSIMTSDGQDVGEIVIRGDFLFDGYYNRPDVTAKKLRDGAYYTGDLGFVDNGELYVIGRNDDLIIVHGKNILAHEVEATLADVDAVKPGRVVCFPVENPDTFAPEIAIAAETRDLIEDDATLQAIREEITASVFATTAVVPFRVHVVGPNSLIKTTSGKMSRHANAARFEDSPI